MRFFDSVSELFDRGSPDAKTQSENKHSNAGYISFRDESAIDRASPDNSDLERYWTYYKQNALVRESIRRYADDVIEPGYRVSTTNDQLQSDLMRWLSGAGIVHGETGVDFSEILHNTVIQHDVRGTGATEVVPRAENPDEPWGFKMLNVATLSGCKYDNQNILIRPEDTDVDGVSTTSRGEAAAYLQYDDEALGGPFDADEVPLSQNDVVKFVLDGDVDDIFGTSRLEACDAEIEGLSQMLRDNEEAIASQGHPYMLFKMGEPNGAEQNPRQGVWPDEKIQSFSKEHISSNYRAGQKDFVPGDVDVEKFSGDVAEIEEILQFYVESIISALPTPKYMLGGHSDSTNRDISKEMEAQYRELVTKTRRALESTFEPTLKRKARALGYSGETVESLELTIAPEPEASPLKSDEFDSQEFKQTMQGLKAGAPDGDVSKVVSPNELRTKFLGLPALEDDEDAPEQSESGDDPSDATEENAELESAAPDLPDSIEETDE